MIGDQIHVLSSTKADRMPPEMERNRTRRLGFAFLRSRENPPPAANPRPLRLGAQGLVRGAGRARSVAGSFLLRLSNEPEVRVNRPEAAQTLLLSALPGIHSQTAMQDERFAIFVFHRATLRPGQGFARAVSRGHHSDGSGFLNGPAAKVPLNRASCPRPHQAGRRKTSRGAPLGRLLSAGLPRTSLLD